jgi:hypothetical protein
MYRVLRGENMREGGQLEGLGINKKILLVCIINKMEGQLDLCGSGHGEVADFS